MHNTQCSWQVGQELKVSCSLVVTEETPEFVDTRKLGAHC
jgi:hypothetical protein